MRGVIKIDDNCKCKLVRKQSMIIIVNKLKISLRDVLIK